MRFRLIIIALLLTCFGLLASGPRYLRLRGFRGLWFAPTWTPTDESHLYGWWKADTLTNLVNGSEIAFWTDSSGRGLHMRPISTGSTTSPYWTNSFQNGLPAVYFDGVNDTLTNACGPSIDNFAISNLFFMVIKYQIPSDVKATVFDALRTPTDHEAQEFSFGGATFNTSQMEDGDAGTGNALLLGTNPGTNVMVTYVCQFADVNSAMWTNGVSVTTTGGPLNGFGLLDGMIVGATRNGDSYFRGYIMEMFCVTNMYSTTVTASGRTVLSEGVAYLLQKWAHY